MRYDVMDIARKLIARAKEDEDYGGAGLTNLKLQKLLYYEQGYHLAVFDEPLFDAPIEAWMYGPVVPAVYEVFRSFGSSVISVENKPVILNCEDADLFDKVYDAYRDFSAIGLMNKTHSERPWQDAIPHEKGTVITQESLKDYFRTQIQ